MRSECENARVKFALLLVHYFRLGMSSLRYHFILLCAILPKSFAVSMYNFFMEPHLLYLFKVLNFFRRREEIVATNSSLNSDLHVQTFKIRL